MLVNYQGKVAGLWNVIVDGYIVERAFAWFWLGPLEISVSDCGPRAVVSQSPFIQGILHSAILF